MYQVRIECTDSIPTLLASHRQVQLLCETKFDLFKNGVLELYGLAADRHVYLSIFGEANKGNKSMYYLINLLTGAGKCVTTFERYYAKKLFEDRMRYGGLDELLNEYLKYVSEWCIEQIASLMALQPIELPKVQPCSKFVDILAQVYQLNLSNGFEYVVDHDNTLSELNLGNFWRSKNKSKKGIGQFKLQQLRERCNEPRACTSSKLSKRDEVNLKSKKNIKYEDQKKMENNDVFEPIFKTRVLKHISQLKDEYSEIKYNTANCDTLRKQSMYTGDAGLCTSSDAYYLDAYSKIAAHMLNNDIKELTLGYVNSKIECHDTLCPCIKLTSMLNNTSYKVNRIEGHTIKFVRLIDILSCYKLGPDLTKLLSVLLNYNWSESQIVGYVLYNILTYERFHLLFFKFDAGLLHTSIEGWLNTRKQASEYFKRFMGYTVFNTSWFFEIHVLANRNYGEIDWLKEYDDRTNFNGPNFSYEEVYLKAINILRNGQPKGEGKIASLVKREWKDFWADRWQWCPSGSFYPTTSRFQKYYNDAKQISPTPNKLTCLMYAPNDLLLMDIINEYHELEARASVKLEWGKARAIYGCCVEDFVLSTFAMPRAEELLPKYCVIGNVDERMIFSEFVASAVDNEHVSFTLDYENFNSQHSFTSMVAVLNAYKYVYHNYMSQEQLCALDCITNALTRTVVHTPIGSYRAIGTLMSGWRLTSFMNTILNVIYIELCSVGMKSTYRSLHTGDDVLCSFRHLSDIGVMINNMDRRGIRYNTTKCHIGTIFEFLRMTSDNLTCCQYTPRAISSLVQSKQEAKSSRQPFEQLAGHVSRMEELIDRMNSRSRAVTTLMTRLCCVSLRNSDTIESAAKTLIFPRVLGGLVNIDPNSKLIDAFNKLNQIVKYRVVGFKDKNSSDMLKRTPGIAAFCTRIYDYLTSVGLDELAIRRNALVNCVLATEGISHIVPNVSQIENTNVYDIIKVRNYIKEHFTSYIIPKFARFADVRLRHLGSIMKEEEYTELRTFLTTPGLIHAFANMAFAW